MAKNRRLEPRRDKQVKFMTDKHELRQLKLLAISEGRSVSNYLRWLIAEKWKEQKL